MFKRAKNYLLKLGIQPNKEIETSLEMRYVGQAFEVPVKLTEENVDNISLALLQKLFAEAHHKIFEFSKPEGDPVEVISIRVGVGEKTFTELARAASISIDCATKSVNVLR